MGRILGSLYMFANGGVGGVILGIFSLAALAFTIWMIADCVRSGRDFYWIWIMLLFWGIGALVYFFAYYVDGSKVFRGVIRRYNLKQQARELEGRVHNIDNAYHRTKLGDAYRDLKRLDKAAESYRAALKHDPKALDACAHLACVLVEQGKFEEAKPLLLEALEENPHYEYGDLLLHAAHCAIGLNDMETAHTCYGEITKKYTYPRARIEYAELLNRTGDHDEAVALLKRVVADGLHAPRYQARAERRNLRRARALLRTMTSGA